MTTYWRKTIILLTKCLFNSEQFLTSEYDVLQRVVTNPFQQLLISHKDSFSYWLLKEAASWLLCRATSLDHFDLASNVLSDVPASLANFQFDLIGLRLSFFSRIYLMNIFFLVLRHSWGGGRPALGQRLMEEILLYRSVVLLINFKLFSRFKNLRWNQSF